MDKIIHIIPLNDDYEHSEECINHIGLIIPICKCNPDFLSVKNTIIHNSFDGREAVEWANEILGN